MMAKKSWFGWPSEAQRPPRSVLPRPRANIPQYGPRIRLESGYYSRF